MQRIETQARVDAERKNAAAASECEICKTQWNIGMTAQNN